MTYLTDGKPAPSLFALHSEQLVSNGYSVIPIQPGAKAPGYFNGKEWRGLPRWSDFCQRLPTDRELEVWNEWPDAGLGIACGAIVGIDIDVLDATASQRIAALARERLGDTPALRIGLAPKQMLVYRAIVPFASFDVTPLQVLCLGKQFVGYGIHPDTGKPYDWPLGSLMEIDIGDLPAVSEAQCRAWAEAAINMVPDEARKSRVVRDGAPAGPQGDIEGATVAGMRQALTFIDSTSTTSMESWIEIGMALHAGLGEDGRELWHEWSARDPSRYTAKETDYRYSSFGRRGGSIVGPGTLYDRARINGWHPDGVFLYAADEIAAETVGQLNIEAIVANGKKRSKPAPVAVEPEPEPKWTVPAGLPAWHRDLDGGLRMFVDHFVETAPSPQPLLTLGAALASFGTLAGRRYAGPTDLRTNIYAVGIADSGGGKDHPLRAAAKLLLAVEPSGSLIGGSKIASGQALLTEVTANPTILFALDELGFFFQVAGNRDKAPSHKTEIVDNLVELYSMADSMFLGTAYANQKERKKEPIIQPCVSLFGVTTPASFWGALSSGNALDGSLARMLIFESENHYPDPRHDLDFKAIPEFLLANAGMIRDGVEGHLCFPLGEGSAATPKPYRVPYANEIAAERARDIREHQTVLLREHQGTNNTSILARLAENCFKLALVKAISYAPRDPKIRLADLEWGYEMSWRSVQSLMNAVRDTIADNEQEAAVKRVLKMISGAGSAGITLSQLTRTTQFLDSRRRNAILLDLVESDSIHMLKLESDKEGGRPKLVYYAL